MNPEDNPSSAVSKAEADCAFCDGTGYPIPGASECPICNDSGVHPTNPFPDASKTTGEPQPSVDHESTVRRQSAALELVERWRRDATDIDTHEDGPRGTVLMLRQCADELEEALKGER